MKSRLIAGMMIMTGLTTLLSACGGGGGGGAAATPITVTAAKNPILVGGSTTITASFAAYTSAVKFGSTVNFSVTSPATVSAATATTQAGGIATITVSSAQAGKFSVAASSGSYAGTTSVAFIPQPASVSMLITPNQAVKNLGALSFDVASDIPVTFSGYSSMKSSGGTSMSISNPNTYPAFNISKITAGLISTTGIDITPTSTLFKLNCATPTAGVPIFTIAQSSVLAAFSNNTSIKPAPVLNISPTYYDGTGKVLFP